MKKVIVSVINDLSTDQRVNKVCLSLHQLGFEITLVGRQQKKSLPLTKRIYKTKRMNLLFEKGPLFYAEFNIRLFFFLLFNKTDVLVSNDLDTLMPNYLISKTKAIPLVYDSHEYFCYVPELVKRPLVQGVWKAIEKFIFPKLKHVITVNDSIANEYKNTYKTDVKVVKNAPSHHKTNLLKSKIELGFPENLKIILYQGSVNMDRGLEELIMAMQYVQQNAILLLIGDGDVLEKLKMFCKEKKIENNIQFMEKIPFHELKHYTAIADIGVSLEKDTNLNYHFSLPNKIFDYIHSGVPVLASSLTEIKKIYEQYNIGELIENHNPKHIAEKINFMLMNEEKRSLWKENCKIAAKDLCWENEEQELLKTYKQFL